MRKVMYWIICFILIICLYQNGKAGILGFVFKGGKMAAKSAKAAKVLKFMEKVPLKKGALFNKEFRLIKPLVKKPGLYDDIVLKYGEKTAVSFFKANKGIADDLIKEFGDDVVTKGITGKEGIKALAYKRVYLNKNLKLKFEKLSKKVKETSLLSKGLAKLLKTKEGRKIVYVCIKAKNCNLSKA